jgi:hypothetical protein
MVGSRKYANGQTTRTYAMRTFVGTLRPSSSACGSSSIARLALLSCYTFLMDTAFAREASFVREVGRLSDRDIARATGAGC